jgi:hypothetical protein
MNYKCRALGILLKTAGEESAMCTIQYIPPHNILVVNPATGDPNAGILWIVLAAIAISAILIVALVVGGRKGR